MPNAADKSVPDRGPIPELCVVIPVINERDNIAPMVARLHAALAGIAWEVIFVDDDSTDGTRAAVHAAASADSTELTGETRQQTSMLANRGRFFLAMKCFFERETRRRLDG